MRNQVLRVLYPSFGFILIHTNCGVSTKTIKLSCANQTPGRQHKIGAIFCASVPTLEWGHYRITKYFFFLKKNHETRTHSKSTHTNGSIRGINESTETLDRRAPTKNNYRYLALATAGRPNSHWHRPMRPHRQTAPQPPGTLRAQLTRLRRSVMRDTAHRQCTRRLKLKTRR